MSDDLELASARFSQEPCEVEERTGAVDAVSAFLKLRDEEVYDPDERTDEERDESAKAILGILSIDNLAVDVLRSYEAWEADVILNADWSRETPRLTQSQWDWLVDIQGKRNAAMVSRSSLPNLADATKKETP